MQRKESLFKIFFKTILIMIVKGFDNTITNVENDAWSYLQWLMNKLKILIKFIYGMKKACKNGTK